MNQTVPHSGSYNMGKVVQLTFVAALGGFLFGYDTSVINGGVDAITDAFELNTFAQGFVVSSALLGSMFGALGAGRVAGSIGRVKVMLIAALLFFASSVGSGFAFSSVDLIVWRLVGGLGIGAASVIAPAYIAEISPAQIRGRLGSMQQLAIVLGIFVSLLADYFIAEAAGGAANELWFGIPAWRWMFLASGVPAVLYGIMAFTIPESPRYLVQKGRDAEARKILGQIMPEGADERIKEIEKTISIEDKSSISDLFKPGTKTILPIVWIGIALSVFQQFVGINVIFYYSTTLWQAVGFTESDAMLTSVITSVTNIVVTIVAIMLIDKIGRRLLLLIGSVGMAISLGTMTVVFAMAPMVPELDANGAEVMVKGAVHMIPNLGDTQALIALIAANLFVVFFGMSWGPTVWVLLGEMFSNKIRAVALGVAAGAQWLANFLISTTFPSMADFGLWFAYGFYTLFAVLSFFFVLKFVKETKGKELEDM